MGTIKLSLIYQPALDVAHGIATNLHKVGAIDSQTMRKFDIKCLPPVKAYTPVQIKRIRVRNKVSQAVLAEFFEHESFYDPPMGARA